MADTIKDRQIAFTGAAYFTWYEGTPDLPEA